MWSQGGTHVLARPGACVTSRSATPFPFLPRKRRESVVGTHSAPRPGPPLLPYVLGVVEPGPVLGQGFTQANNAITYPCCVQDV